MFSKLSVYCTCVGFSTTRLESFLSHYRNKWLMVKHFTSQKPKKWLHKQFFTISKLWFLVKCQWIDVNDEETNVYTSGSPVEWTIMIMICQIKLIVHRYIILNVKTFNNSTGPNIQTIYTQLRQRRENTKSNFYFLQSTSNAPKKADFPYIKW